MSDDKPEATAWCPTCHQSRTIRHNDAGNYACLACGYDGAFGEPEATTAEDIVEAVRKSPGFTVRIPTDKLAVARRALAAGEVEREQQRVNIGEIKLVLEQQDLTLHRKEEERKRLEKLNAEMVKHCDGWRAANRSLEQDRDRLQEALEKHGRHSGHCNNWCQPPRKCTCGLDAALAGGGE